jgi:hypothetical protein
MASLILSTLGGALGPIGAAAGAIAGAAIDRLAISALTPVQKTRSRLADLQVQTSTEGAAMPLIYGTMRIAGQVIWAGPFTETTSVRRVGGKTGPKVEERRYAISFAVALCEGPISGIGRVWANGEVLDLSGVTMRVHTGGPAQDPDPLIAAAIGAQAPAFLDVAYVVFEDLPLAGFGDRIPQLTFEVMRPAPDRPGMPGLASLARAVTLIPGSGEFAYATTPVMRRERAGVETPENRHAGAGRANLAVALDQLEVALPQLEATTIVSAWFGTDLRAGACTIEPGVETAAKATRGAVWSVGGRTRDSARVVTSSGGGPAYGGTPSDASLIEAIGEARARGLSVTLYPFVLMDIPAGNTKPDPWGAGAQAPYPWRGRISCHPAPGAAGSPDGTATAATQVGAFFGTAAAADFSWSSSGVSYGGPAEWSFRRMVLHHAALAMAAGGVDVFVIGSELVGLTRVRGAADSYPAVAALKALAAEARAILGPGVKITYAADWTEYGAHVRGGDVDFPLDALWADANIDCVGLDWYPPLADWRDGAGHADAALASGPHDPAYLAGRTAAGEAFDWYYADAAARASQARSPITDGAAGKPWVFRQKDLRGWWENAHVPRRAGAELATPTAWAPRSKPIRIIELGVPAVDKGANQPNLFFDPKSAESALPFGSSGARDDLIQRRALEAWLTRFAPGSPGNPVSPVYGGPMVDPHIGLWTWDARPFPQFPALETVWSDGGNWRLGHWLTGRLGATPLADIVADLARRAGFETCNADALTAMVEGFVLAGGETARSALDALMRAYGVFARVEDGTLTFRPLDVAPPAALDPVACVPGRQDVGCTVRQGEADDAPVAVRAHAFDPARDGRAHVAEARAAAGATRRVETIALPLALSGEALAVIADEALREAGAARDRMMLRLPPSRLVGLEPGDTATTPDGDLYRVVRIDGAEASLQRLPRGAGRRGALQVSPPVAPPPPPLAPAPALVIANAPDLDGREDRRPIFAAAAKPWTGPHLVEAGASVADLTVRARIERRATLGALASALAAGPVGVWDRAGVLEVSLVAGVLSSASPAQMLGGANLAAVVRDDGAVEMVRFAAAELIGPDRWRLSGLLRGLFGTEDAAATTAPVGAAFLLIDDAVVRPDLADAEREAPLLWRCTPFADPLAATETTFAPWPVALRPWRPVQLRARREAGGVRISWLRQARRGGEAWTAGEPPPCESTLWYRLEIRTTAGDLVRALDVTDSNWLYPAAQETADFGASQTMLRVGVAQYGDEWGVGPWAERIAPVTSA